MTKFLASLAAIVSLLIYVQTARAQSTRTDEFGGISRKEVELLIADVAEKNPDVVKRLAADPKLKTRQLEDMKQLFAFASQAEKDGLADDPITKQELSYIRSEVIAANFDRELNKDKPAQTPFSSITDVQMKQFWGDPAKKEGREGEFKRFFDTKIALLRRENPDFSETVDQEEIQLARDFFAKTQIDAEAFESKAKAGILTAEFIQRANLQVRLQRAQYLAKAYSNTAAEKVRVSDDEIGQYISRHAELSPDAKRARALDILKRAKAGEDFATLANQFTEDPGNKGSDGKLNGGLYADVRKGVMVAPFEHAALALEPGQVSPDLVESDFGFHIIKLEKKSDAKDENGNPTQTYDVRHILIETMYADPADPTAQPRPVREYVKERIQSEKQKRLIEDLISANNISVPDDYTFPAIREGKTPVATKKPTTVGRKTPGGRKRATTRKRAHK